MIRVRPYRPDDAPALAAIYLRAVQEGTARFYSGRERDAWAAAAADPLWPEKLADQITVVAETTQMRPAGFMTLGHDGHLDLAYVTPEAMGTGVAAALHDRILAIACDNGLARLETEASYLARRFLLKQGWIELFRQEVIRDGVRITNFRMAKLIRRI